MEGKRLLHKLGLTNFLSYGPEGVEIELEPLNVLIGPNGSGKSNFIQALSLLKAAPGEVSAPIRRGGGMPQWPYKGGGGSPAIDFEIEATVSYLDAVPLRYGLHLTRVGQGLELLEETIEDETITAATEREHRVYYEYRNGEPAISALEISSSSGVPDDKHGEVTRRVVDLRDISRSNSILAQRKDPDRYPELTYLGHVLSEIRLFRSCSLGPDSPLLGPQGADQPSSFLSEDGSNLGMVLNRLLAHLPVKKRILAELKRFCDPIEDISQRVEANTIETLFHERGFMSATPSARLSGGTLRYLWLLTILCHPNPPPLICIEDPEIAFHPDALPRLADLLVEASEKSQLVVTTHSDVLVSALSSVPEAVVICERDDYGSHLARLDATSLEEWLRKYSLGELWMSGEIGGNP